MFFYLSIPLPNVSQHCFAFLDFFDLCSWIVWPDCSAMPLAHLSCMTCFLVFTVILSLDFFLCSSFSLALAVQGDPDVRLKTICLCECACVEVVSKNVKQCGQQPLFHFHFSGDIFCTLSLTLSFFWFIFVENACCLCLTVSFSFSLSKRCAVLRLLLWSISVCHPLPVGRVRSGPECRVS